MIKSHEISDPTVKSEAAISLGMANANLKWGDKCKEITDNLKNYGTEADNDDHEEDYEEIQDVLKRQLDKIKADNTIVSIKDLSVS